METKEKESVKEVLPIIETEKKREIISVQITPEEKRKITRMAIKECGISVSEFVRTKIFMDHKTINENNDVENPVLDEERVLYEDKLSELNEENKKLKDEIVKIKVAFANPNNEIDEVVTEQINENELKINFAENSKVLIDSIKTFRDEKFKNLSEKEKENFFSFEKYLVLLLIRGLKRSYYFAALNSNTGLNIDDVRKIAEFEKIDYEETV